MIGSHRKLLSGTRARKSRYTSWLLASGLSLALLVSLQPCGELFVGIFNPDPADVGSTPVDYNFGQIAHDSYSGKESPHCCGWTHSDRNPAKAVPVVLKDRAPKPVAFVATVLAWDAWTAKRYAPPRSAYRLPYSKTPLYLRLKQLLI